MHLTYVRRETHPKRGGAVTEPGDVLTAADAHGGFILAMPAPPFITRMQYETAMPRLTSRPGLDLTVQWSIDDWPTYGHREWTQIFRDGIEDSGAPESDAPQDLTVRCGYADMAGFQFGVTPLWEMSGKVEMQGGLGPISSLTGLVFDRSALRAGSATPTQLAGVLAALRGNRLESRVGDS